MASRFGTTILLALTLAGLDSAFGQDIRQYPDEKIGAFHYFQHKDDFDDTDQSFIFTLEADSRLESLLFGGAEIASRGVDDNLETAALGWVCGGGEMLVGLSLRQPYTGDQDKQILVRYRFDEDDPSMMHAWDLSQNKHAVLPVRNEPAFTVAAKASNSVIVQAYDPFDGKSNRYRFSLSGFTRALSLLTCAEHSPRTLE